MLLMPKSLTSVEDHVSDILETRRVTQSGRFAPRDPSAETVSEVVDECMTEVGAALVPEGFRYSKSRRRFARKNSEFSFEIWFQSDSENLSGVHVGLAAHASVKSKGFAQWKQSVGLDDSEYVWVSQLGYLSEEHDYLKWQFADHSKRKAETEDMIKRIRQLALGTFTVYESGLTLRDQILLRKELLTYPRRGIELALWLKNKRAADALVAVELSRPRFNRIEFADSLSKFRERGFGFSLQGHSHAAALAALVVNFNLDMPVNS